MESKAIIFLFTSFLLVVFPNRVSSTDHEELNMKAFLGIPPIPVPASAQIPVKAPIPAKTPTFPPAKSPIIAPIPPPRLPIKAPSPAPMLKPPPSISPRPPIKSTADCVVQCGERCHLHSRKSVCMRACVTCCGRCKCVPPGTFGSREMCGTCYTGMTTHGNKSKCP